LPGRPTRPAAQPSVGIPELVMGNLSEYLNPVGMQPFLDYFSRESFSPVGLVHFLIVWVAEQPLVTVACIFLLVLILRGPDAGLGLSGLFWSESRVTQFCNGLATGFFTGEIASLKYLSWRLLHGRQEHKPGRSNVIWSGFNDLQDFAWYMVTGYAFTLVA